MREFTRCIAWAFGLGALAFLAAAMTGVGLGHAEGWMLWLALAVYAPFHLVVHAFEASVETWREDSILVTVAFVAQFLYFLAIVAAVRLAWRNRQR